MSTNDITGAELKTKAATAAYREGYDRIFGARKQLDSTCQLEVTAEEEEAFNALPTIQLSGEQQ